MLQIDHFSPKVQSYLRDLTEGNEEDLTNLKKVKEVLNKVFGEERNQITPPSWQDLVRNVFTSTSPSDARDWTMEMARREINRHVSAKYCVIVHFPEVTIQNSKKFRHIIRDLYVRFFLANDGKMSNSLDGIRTTLTPTELSARYMHSHLTCFADKPRWQSFCRGSGEINQVMGLLATKFTEVNFTLFCLHLRNFVAWESLEGTPYNYIQNIALTRPVQPVHYSYLQDAVKQLTQNIFSTRGIDSWIKENLRIALSPEGVRVSTTIDFEAWATQHMERVGYGSLNVLVGTDGRYYSPNGTPRRSNGVLSGEAPFTFKKEKVFFKLLTDTKDEIQHEVCIHPEIRQEFCRRLGHSFTQEAFKAQDDHLQENTPPPVPQTTESDFLSL